MKVKHIILIFFGVLFLMIGSLFKIMHWVGAGVLLLSASVIEVLSIVLAIWKVFTIEKFKDFLNS